MDKATRAEARLDVICSRLGISDDGRKWLDCALDPFKDTGGIKPTGFPDQITLPSCVEVIPDEFVISAPSGVAGNWDANIFIDKLYLQELLVTTPYGFNFFFQTGQGTSINTSRGGLVVRSAASGTALDITTTTFASSLKSDTLANAEIRVLGIGMEIHNTTASLEKQGSIICWQAIEDRDDQNYVANVAKDSATAVLPQGFIVKPLPWVPLSAGDAIDLPGSLQWEAAEGAYMVPKLADETNPPQQSIRSFEIDDQLTPIYYGTPIQVSGVTYSTGVFNLRHAFNVFGAYLTGLSNQTTLQVNLKYYVEVFPNKSNTLKRFTGSGCASDAVALRLYSKIRERMPVAVPVKDNNMGAWISGIANVAGSILGGVESFGRQIGVDLSPSNIITTAIRGFSPSSPSIGPNVNINANRQRAVVVPPHTSREIVVHNNSNQPVIEDLTPTHVNTTRTISTQAPFVSNVRRGKILVTGRNDKDLARSMKNNMIPLKAWKSTGPMNYGNKMSEKKINKRKKKNRVLVPEGTIPMN